MKASIEVVADYRDRLYQEYAKNVQGAGESFDAEQARRWGRAYLHYFRGWFPDRHARIVDLACGGGRLLHFMTSQGYTNLSGVDLSPDQVALARQVTPDVTQQNVLEFLHGHAQTFELIIALDIVEHFRKPEVLDFLDRCHRALKPGGRLILQTPNADSPWFGSVRYGDFTHEVAFNSASLSSLLRLAGFKDLETRETGPLPTGKGLVSSLRWLMWRSIRLLLQTWSLAETGSAGSGILTRVFLISGRKAEEGSSHAADF